MSLVGVLFDVSGSMRCSLENVNVANNNKKSFLIENIIETLGKKLNLSLFSMIFGCTDKLDEIADLFLLIETIDSEISTQRFKSQEFSSYSYGNSNYYDYKRKLLDLFNLCGANTLEKYIYGKSGPTNNECQLIYNVLKDDRSLTQEIFNGFPENVKGIKGFVTSGLLKLDVLGVTQNMQDDMVRNEVRKTLEIVLKKNKDKVMHEVYDKMNKSIAKYKSLKNSGKEFQLRTSNNVSSLIEKSKACFFNGDRNLYEELIYGGTPMTKGISEAFRIIETNYGKKNKLLFIISDGESTDGNPTGITIEKSTRLNVKIASLFFSRESYFTKELYYSLPNRNNYYNYYSLSMIPNRNNDNGERTLFNISSELDSNNFLCKFFQNRGWKIPAEGKCRLFFQSNNSKIINEFIDIIGDAFSVNDAFINNINNIDFSLYVKNNFIDSFQAKRQVGPICWSFAISTVIHLASSRVYGRKIAPFEQIHKSLFEEFKYEKEGQNTAKVLERVLPHYRLRYQKVNEVEARMALIKGRPCVFSFSLSETQWEKWDEFYKTGKGKTDPRNAILTRDVLGEPEPKDKLEGHAVVLIRCSPDKLTFLNSWGSYWSDNGFFHAKSGDIFERSAFYDIFWYESDLSEEEKNAWKNHSKEVEDTFNGILNEDVLRNTIYEELVKCPKCQNRSKASLFSGSLVETTCPNCRQSFKPDDILDSTSKRYLKQALYLKLLD